MASPGARPSPSNCGISPPAVLVHSSPRSRRRLALALWNWTMAGSSRALSASPPAWRTRTTSRPSAPGKLILRACRHSCSDTPEKLRLKETSEMFSSVLIANRGEIAVRAMRTLKRLGIRSIAVYAEPDRNSPHVRAADTAIALGGDKPADSYLRIDKLIAACQQSRAEAVFPGYGLLSESPEFAAACEGAGMIFLGPTPGQMRDFGLKHRARELAHRVGLPLTPGTGLLSSVEEALREAERIGYPIMLKSAAGGGGIGLSRCETPGDLTAAFESVGRLGRQFFR